MHHKAPLHIFRNLIHLGPISLPSSYADLNPESPSLSDDPGAMHQPGLPLSILERLPAELIDSILSCLSPHDLVAFSATCKALHERATDDILWRPLVQENIPGSRLTTPYPFGSYRELYATHDTKWFLTKHKIWFCGRDLVGKLLLARYDQRRGCIEAYQLVAMSNRTSFHNWLPNEDAVLHPFEPRVMLHVDKPVVKFAANIDPDSSRARELYSIQGRGFTPEVPMVVDENPETMRCNFILAKPLPSEKVRSYAAEPFPYGSLWPPPAIPRAPHHVTGLLGSEEEVPQFKADDLPACRTEASEYIFRIRQWLELAAGSPAAVIINHSPGGSMARMGAHVGEHITTYSTLDPALYTPTPLKPWRGIWVGDYSMHGCEFLLVHQEDEEPVSDEDLGLRRSEDETEEDWEARRLEKRVYTGRLEAIKLTGDPNIPRGERTFIAEDLSSEAYRREAEDGPFSGARVVPSKGHVARTGFQEGKYSD